MTPRRKWHGEENIYKGERWQIGSKWGEGETGHVTSRRKWHGKQKLYKGEMAAWEQVGYTVGRERENRTAIYWRVQVCPD